MDRSARALGNLSAQHTAGSSLNREEGTTQKLLNIRKKRNSHLGKQ